MQEFVRRRAGAAREILGEVFTVHPLRNAWDQIGFGSNPHGIFGATLDNLMHFNESGLFDGVTKAFCGCFTVEELKKFEESTRSLCCNSRSSVKSEHPKRRISKGFTSYTPLKTANETVGSLLSVVLTVEDDSVFDVMDAVGKKQQQHHLTFPATISPKLSSKRTKKETKLCRKASVTSKLVATYTDLLELHPS